MEAEQKLIEQASTGNRDALEKIAELHLRRIYCLALQLTGNRHDAEDLTQEALIKGLCNIDKFKGDSKLSSWFHRITVNTFLDDRRKEVRRPRGNLIPVSDDALTRPGISANPERRLVRREEKKMLDESLDCLSPMERSVFILRQRYDYKIREIAQSLKISIGATKSLLYKAVKKLKRNIELKTASES